MVNKLKELKITALDICAKAGVGHVSSWLSCAEILYVLYYHVMKPGNNFILSKGHASPLLYTILADKGYISHEELQTFGQPGSRLGVHLNDEVPGVDAISGSLGYGLGIGAGMAYAHPENHVYVLLGDGECQEGSVWESAMLVGRLKLNNLIAIIDYNTYAATPSNRPVVNWNWSNFGWEHTIVDGHDVDKLISAIDRHSTRPRLVIAKTIKGHGVSFLIDAPLWHGGAPVGKLAKQARRELLDA
jgi:transketolase